MDLVTDLDSVPAEDGVEAGEEEEEVAKAEDGVEEEEAEDGVEEDGDGKISLCRMS